MWDPSITSTIPHGVHVARVPCPPKTVLSVQSPESEIWEPLQIPNVLSLPLSSRTHWCCYPCLLNISHIYSLFSNPWATRLLILKIQQEALNTPYLFLPLFTLFCISQRDVCKVFLIKSLFSDISDLGHHLESIHVLCNLLKSGLILLYRIPSSYSALDYLHINDSEHYSCSAHKCYFFCWKKNNFYLQPTLSTHTIRPMDFYVFLKS